MKNNVLKINLVIIICFVSRQIFTEQEPTRETFILHALSEKYIFINPIELCKTKNWDQKYIAELSKTIYEDIVSGKNITLREPLSDRSVNRLKCFSLDYYAWCTDDHGITNLLYSYLYDKTKISLQACSLQSILHHISENELSNIIVEVMENKKDVFSDIRNSLIAYVIINGVYFPERKEIMYNAIWNQIEKTGSFIDIANFDDCSRYYLTNYEQSAEREIILQKAIEAFQNNPENKEDWFLLEEYGRVKQVLKEIHRQERKEWWKKHRRYIVFGIGILVIGISIVVWFLSIHCKSRKGDEICNGVRK